MTFFFMYTEKKQHIHNRKQGKKTVSKGLDHVCVRCGAFATKARKSMVVETSWSLRACRLGQSGSPRSEKKNWQLGESRKFTRSSRCGFVAQWLERATRPWVRFPAGLRCVFSSDPAVSSSIFVGAEREENLIQMTFFFMCTEKKTTHTQQKTREKTVSKGLDHVCVRCGAFATKARKSMVVETSFAGALVRECTDAYDGPVYARVDAARWSRDCTLI